MDYLFLVLPISIWLIETVVLAKDEFTVSRRTTVYKFGSPKGYGFCSAFWVTGFLYWMGGAVVLGLSYFLVVLVVGTLHLLYGVSSEESGAVIALFLITILVGTMAMFHWTVKVTYNKFKSTANIPSKVPSKNSALKGFYKMFKDKYCPIIK